METEKTFLFFVHVDLIKRVRWFMSHSGAPSVVEKVFLATFLFGLAGFCSEEEDIFKIFSL